MYDNAHFELVGSWQKSAETCTCLQKPCAHADDPLDSVVCHFSTKFWVAAGIAEERGSVNRKNNHYRGI